MIRSNLNKRYISSILIITLLAMLAGTMTGCYASDQWEPPPQAPQEKTEVPTPPLRTKVRTEDRALMAVYEHLLSQAESHKAKAYLANFYATCDNWTAESELRKDGSSIWHVVVDMTDVEVWEERAYWQQTSWFILQDGKVIPSNRFQANALRIEADLQELSLLPKSAAGPSDSEKGK